MQVCARSTLCIVSLKNRKQNVASDTDEDPHKTTKDHPTITVWSACEHGILALEFIVGAEQQRLLRVAGATDGAVGAGDGRRRPLLQRGLLSILLVGRREVVDGVLDHVARAHGLLQAAGDALHGRAAACKKGSGLKNERAS